MIEYLEISTYMASKTSIYNQYLKAWKAELPWDDSPYFLLISYYLLNFTFLSLLSPLYPLLSKSSATHHGEFDALFFCHPSYP